MHQKPDHQGAQLHSNDIEVGIERGAYGRRVQEEHVRPLVGRPRRILEARLFLQEEHLRTEAWIVRSALYRRVRMNEVYDAVPRDIREWVLCSYTEAIVVSL